VLSTTTEVMNTNAPNLLAWLEAVHGSGGAGGVERDGRHGLAVLLDDDLELAHEPWQELLAPVELHGSEEPSLLRVRGANGSLPDSKPQEPVSNGHPLPNKTLGRAAGHRLPLPLRHAKGKPTRPGDGDNAGPSACPRKGAQSCQPRRQPARKTKAPRPPLSRVTSGPS
jgi:hypothetical protein